MDTNFLLDAPTVPYIDFAFYLEPLINCYNRKETISDFVTIIQNNHINFDYIACRGASGLIFASMLGYETNKPICIVRKENEKGGSHSRRDIEFPNISVKHSNKLKYVICDDLIDSGITINTIISSINVNRKDYDECVSIFLYKPLSLDTIYISNSILNKIPIYSPSGRMKIY